MKTKPIETPHVGMIIANQEARMFATIRSVDEKGFNFWLHNGEWGGRIEDDEMTIFDTKEVMPLEGTFEQVIGISRQEAEVTYLDRAAGIRKLIAIGDGDNAFERFAKLDPHGPDVDRAAMALEMVESNSRSRNLDTFITKKLIQKMKEETALEGSVDAPTNEDAGYDGSRSAEIEEFEDEIDDRHDFDEIAF
ncbi:MAG: hypothetical protein ABJN42_13685 [Roseibium sp.]|uniref:hypothetical protein n=1 Tax=Alphaproteobacteria TaxID=28211 RepID=UPI00329A072D